MPEDKQLKEILEQAHQISIFSDGACSGNPGPGGWGSILYTDKKYVVELGGGDPRTTNNKMEMTALLRALQKIGALNKKVHLTIYTDSKYLIQGLTEWIYGWKRNNWQTKLGEPVANQELWQELDENLRTVKTKINWQYVPGHSGFPGNERCDEIAVGFSKKEDVYLYAGLRSEYSVDLDVDINEFKEKLKTSPIKKPNKKNQKAYCYLSLIHGKLERHETWESCQSRIHGVPNAKFKKAISPEDEKQILTSWGIRNS